MKFVISFCGPGNHEDKTAHPLMDRRPFSLFAGARWSQSVRRLMLLTSCGLMLLPAAAQILPDAPVINFRLPMFGDDGNPVWELRGQEGRYLSEEKVDLTGMRLLVFDPEQPNRVETEILSPSATMLVQHNQVRGDESITVTGDNFIITGQRWLYDADERRVVIDEDVKITFFEELSSMLVFP